MRRKIAERTSVSKIYISDVIHSQKEFLSSFAFWDWEIHVSYQIIIKTHLFKHLIFNLYLFATERKRKVARGPKRNYRELIRD